MSYRAPADARDERIRELRERIAEQRRMLAGLRREGRGLLRTWRMVGHRLQPQRSGLRRGAAGGLLGLGLVGAVLVLVFAAVSVAEIARYQRQKDDFAEQLRVPRLMRLLGDAPRLVFIPVRVPSPFPGRDPSCWSID